MLHDKADSCAGLAATEAFIYAFAGRNGKRRGLLIMERTARDMIGTSFLQSNEVTYHIHDLRRIEDPVYRFLRDHMLLLVYFLVLDILDLRERIILRLSLFPYRSLMNFILIDGLLHLP